MVEGFKHTEVGLIPEDWDANQIKDFTDLVSGGTPSTLVSEYWGGEIRWMSSGELNLKRIHDVEGRITEIGLKNSATKIIPEKCVLIGLAGQGKTRGTVAMNYVQLCTNQSIAAILPCDSVDEDYIYHNLDSRYKELRTLSTGDGGRGGLNLTLLRNLYIPLPPTKAEQTAIATTLNETDELITTLEKLIAKKKAIKQGAMQELLRPKEGWVEKPLGKVLKVRHGKSQKEVSDENGKYPILASGGFIGQATTFLYDKPSVLIGRKGTIDEPQFMNTPFWTVDTLFYTEIFEPNDPKFIYYMFNLIDWYSYNEASGVPSLNAKTIELIEKSFPKNPDEQKIIAEILTDMDSEIEELEQKLEKQKQIKQGMMQVLLTGKIRLK